MSTIANMSSAALALCKEHRDLLRAEIEKAVIRLEEMGEAGSFGDGDWREALEVAIRRLVRSPLICVSPPTQGDQGDALAANPFRESVTVHLARIEAAVHTTSSDSNLEAWFQERYASAKRVAVRAAFCEALLRIDTAILRTRIVRNAMTRTGPAQIQASVLVRTEDLLHELREVRGEIAEELDLLGEASSREA
ncbi:hypothetical protein BV20DRAFT_959241 [Pilatotrama ljubarskyi]|nr:hypothetical protein BV20DRAFT_959241 [Pilatotrama ljubarskyi]